VLDQAAARKAAETQRSLSEQPQLCFKRTFSIAGKYAHQKDLVEAAPVFRLRGDGMQREVEALIRRANEKHAWTSQRKLACSRCLRRSTYSLLRVTSRQRKSSHELRRFDCVTGLSINGSSDAQHASAGLLRKSTVTLRRLSERERSACGTDAAGPCSHRHQPI